MASIGGSGRMGRGIQMVSRVICVSGKLEARGDIWGYSVTFQGHDRGIEWDVGKIRASSLSPPSPLPAVLN